MVGSLERNLGFDISKISEEGKKNVEQKVLDVVNFYIAQGVELSKEKIKYPGILIEVYFPEFEFTHDELMYYCYAIGLYGLELQYYYTDFIDDFRGRLQKRGLCIGWKNTF